MSICDPHAADAVFGAAWPVTVVGLDVTHQVLMSTAYLDALGDEGGAEGRYLRDITRRYERFYQQRTGGGIYAHDASAVACALDASRFEMRHGALRVVTEGPAMGQTIQSRRGLQHSAATGTACPSSAPASRWTRPACWPTSAPVSCADRAAPARRRRMERGLRGAQACEPASATG